MICSKCLGRQERSRAAREAQDTPRRPKQLGVGCGGRGWTGLGNWPRRWSGCEKVLWGMKEVVKTRSDHGRQ